MSSRLTQESIVILITILACLIFSIIVPYYLDWDNLMTLARNISILGIFALGMGVVLIGGGIDLSQTAIALVAVGIAVHLMQGGLGTGEALLAGFVCAAVMGAANAFLVTNLRIPPLFATLVSAVMFVGLARSTVLDSMIIHVPAASHAWLRAGGTVAGIPIAFIVYACLAILVHGFLSRTVPGKFLYALGANPRTAVRIGLPCHRLIFLKYVISAVVGFVGGTLMVASTAMVDLKSAGTGMVFDVLMVGVLGGISLSGGRGGVASVIAGTLLIGVLFNGMTLLDLGPQVQNIIKGMVLLAAIMLDGWLVGATGVV